MTDAPGRFPVPLLNKRCMKIQVIKNGQQVGEIKVINNMAVIDGIIEFNVQDERYISFISALKNNGYILR